jgi:perosamine synthetase
MIAIAQPLLGPEEEAAIHRVLLSGQLAQGKHVSEFEQRFAQMCLTQDAVATSSGTAALFLALLAHEVGPGDEVITTAFSFIATANVILLVGATPVFVDIDPLTFNIDPEQVETAITSRTKAILPVHLYGNPCDMSRLVELAQIYHLALIEDACQAHAATINGQPVGSFGTGCFSFYATKNMTTGEGGMLTTNNPVIAERVRQLRNQGQETHYHHLTLGYNLRMTEIQAAIGLVQLEKLAFFTRMRIEHAAFLDSELKTLLPVPVVAAGYRHVYHQYTIRVLAAGERDTWAHILREHGVATGIHYPCPIHQQPFYRQSPHLYRIGSVSGTQAIHLPAAEQAARQVLSLPVHPGLQRDDLQTIAREVVALCA